MTNLQLSDSNTSKRLLEKYKQLLLIRQIELSIGRESKKGTFRTPIHLAIGQEAIAIGVSEFLRNDDYIFGNHRSHAHYLALGCSPQGLIAEILGKKSGCSGGKGGSMHIKGTDKGFMGSMPIVAGTISIAVGAAMAIPMGSQQISVSYFGDGASEEGVFHESLNFASHFNAPILFVCENNLFSSHMHIDERQNSSSISRFAESAGISSFQVDGNNLLAVMECAERAISYVRETRKPAFIEALTYRIFSHVGFDADLDVGKNRKEDLEKWAKRDPILLLREFIESEYSVQPDWNLVEEEIVREVELLWEVCKNEAFPSAEALLDGVYWKDE
jgi:pyruvate dehydrogenase E1 component alpha subunit